MAYIGDSDDCNDWAFCLDLCFCSKKNMFVFPDPLGIVVGAGDG